MKTINTQKTMTKKEAVNTLMSFYPRDFRRSAQGKANEAFFNKVLECKTYVWPDARIIVEHTTNNDYTINRF